MSSELPLLPAARLTYKEKPGLSPLGLRKDFSWVARTGFCKVVAGKSFLPSQSRMRNKAPQNAKGHSFQLAGSGKFN